MKKEVRSPVSLLVSLQSGLWIGSQGVSAGVGNWNERVSGEGARRRGSMRSTRGGAAMVLCCRAWNEIGGWTWRSWGRGRCAVSLPDCLPGQNKGVFVDLLSRQSHYVVLVTWNSVLDQAGLYSRNLPAFVSQMLRIKVCNTLASDLYYLNENFVSPWLPLFCVE